MASVAIGVTLIGAFFLVRALTKDKTSTIPSTSPTENTTQSETSTNGSGSNSQTSQTTAISDDKSTTATPSISTNLKEPTGSFVSNHFPGKNGSPTTEQSVCNTQPGANCYIEFSKDGTIKKLSSQTADSSGSVYWNWDVKDAGLDTGSWQITAVASLNGQVKTAKDAMLLEIQP